MYKVQKISDYPKQTKTFNLPGGDRVSFTIYFVPMQKSWYITNLVSGDNVINGIKVVTNPNILRAYKNILGFGLACYSTEGRDPQFVEDFIEGKNTLYILSKEEVDAYEDLLSGR